MLMELTTEIVTCGRYFSYNDFFLANYLLGETSYNLQNRQIGSWLLNKLSMSFEVLLLGSHG